MPDFENNMFTRRLDKFGTYFRAVLKFRGLITSPELRHLRDRILFHEVSLCEILKSDTLTCSKVAPPKPEPVVVRVNSLDILNDDAAKSGTETIKTGDLLDKFPDAAANLLTNMLVCNRKDEPEKSTGEPREERNGNRSEGGDAIITEKAENLYLHKSLPKTAKVQPDEKPYDNGSKKKTSHQYPAQIGSTDQNRSCHKSSRTNLDPPRYP